VVLPREVREGPPLHETAVAKQDSRKVFRASGAKEPASMASALSVAGGMDLLTRSAGQGACSEVS
jgi:hypothetical protein